jgi:glyoxylase-like metal-dependent hydrolase (beta-lactamase superfamily II)
MKKLLFILLLGAVAISINAQNASGWLQMKKVGPQVWSVSDNGTDNMYIVEGKDKAMLIDTGTGVADISSLVSRTTSKPLIVVNTHAHPDHSGGNYQFSEVYIQPRDSAGARPYSKYHPVNGNSGIVPSPAERFNEKPYNTRFLPLKDGQIFDLGERRIQIIEAPGHTAGEICLLDIENKILFTGDNTNALVWLFLPVCRPLHEYLLTLEMLEKRLSEYNTIMPGHKDPLPSDFIKDQVECVKAILNKSIEVKPYTGYGDDAKISVYNRASVCFNPKNL